MSGLAPTLASTRERANAGAKPVRLQLSRKKGFDLQAHSREVNGLPAVMVARRSAFGNPFAIGNVPDAWQADRWCWELDSYERWHVCADAETAIALFVSRLAEDELSRLRVKNHLAGQNLACWCKPGDPCHACVLLDLANAGVATPPRAGERGRG